MTYFDYKDVVPKIVIAWGFFVLNDPSIHTKSGHSVYIYLAAFGPSLLWALPGATNRQFSLGQSAFLAIGGYTGHIDRQSGMALLAQLFDGLVSGMVACWSAWSY
jgi:ABC-type branched-subunit amino acid transport system permease subunit